MASIDDEEIIKALRLEEKALDEFKRRKSSLPAQQNYGRNTNGNFFKKKNFHSNKF